MIVLQAASTAGTTDLSTLNAFILGIVEGLTEFLPVSSTAHLDLTRQVLHLASTDFMKSFEIIIQLGAILSVVVLYWTKIWNKAVFPKLAVAFIPTAIIGKTLYPFIKGQLLGNNTVMLLALIIGGIALIIFERVHRPGEEEVDFSQISYGKAVAIGLFQSLAMIPGTSRSAATIVGGSLIGISKRTIVEFSFMLAVPTMFAATLYDLYKSHGAIGGNFSGLAVGFVVSFVTAILAIKFFLALVKRHAFSVFGWYRIVLAVVFWLIYVRAR